MLVNGKWLQIAVPEYVSYSNLDPWRILVQQSGAIDADRDKILEPLTPIWMEFWSRWRRFGWNSGAIDAFLDNNVEPLPHSRPGLARKI